MDYEYGISQNCRLTMDIVYPDRKGKRFFLGVDISEDSQFYVEFLYEKQGQLYRMKTVDLGSRGKIDLSEQKQDLKSIISPFPLEDCIPKEFGHYRVPFLRSDNKTAFFEFPGNYRRKQF